jgi:D-glycero-alpha-D-manno-heptose-7-phosphate kinase
MIVVRAPLRVSFFGGGTDHPGWFIKSGRGAVLSTTINKYVYIQLRRLPNVFEFNYRVVWSKVEQTKTCAEIEHPVVRAVLQHYGAGDRNGYEVVYNADLPARSGLGSSSAFTVAMLHAFLSEQGRAVSKRLLASEAIRVEQDLLNEPVGCQDQVACAFGGLNRIDFHDQTDFNIAPLVVPADRRAMLQDHMLLCFTGFTRSASAIESEKVQNFDAKAAQMSRLYDMVEQGAEILSNPNRNLDEFGSLLHDAWVDKRSLSKSVSNSDLDDIYDTARAAGAIGGKLLGAGGGGFFLFFAPPSRHPKIIESLRNVVHVPIQLNRGGCEVVMFDPELSSNYIPAQPDFVGA